MLTALWAIWGDVASHTCLDMTRKDMRTKSEPIRRQDLGRTLQRKVLEIELTWEIFGPRVTKLFLFIVSQDKLTETNGLYWFFRVVGCSFSQIASCVDSVLEPNKAFSCSLINIFMNVTFFQNHLVNYHLNPLWPHISNLTHCLLYMHCFLASGCFLYDAGDGEQARTKSVKINEVGDVKDMGGDQWSYTQNDKAIVRWVFLSLRVGPPWVNQWVHHRSLPPIHLLGLTCLPVG